MADALQASCAAPLFKRPRLDFSTRNAVSESSYEGSLSPDAFRDDSELQRSSSEITSSSDSQFDQINGDSGFHDSLPPSNGIDSAAAFTTSSTTSYQQYTENEPDSSNIGLDEDFCSNIASQSPDGDYDDDDVASTVSELSGLSDLSNFSNPDCSKETAGPFWWVQRQMESGADPRELLAQILPGNLCIPPNVNSNFLWRLLLSYLLSEGPQRTKLEHVNKIDDVVNLMKNSSKIMVLTGAGVSVSCGIPDFRSRNGVYARLSQDYPDLPDPQAMFDIHYFRKDPRPFFKFAKEIYPGQFHPSPSHHFIKLIEKHGKLLRNYTQNIDTLEHVAGIQKVITCHGSFATATCTVCRYKVDSSHIKEDIFEQRIPYCPVCPAEAEERGIMKPDIVFFGEGLSDEFHNCMANDKDECDLLIVMGSSLKVKPVALIPNSLPPSVPQVLINREPLKHLVFDVELLGDCDVIIAELCRRLGDGWKIEGVNAEPLTEITSLPSASPPVEKHFDQFHVENSEDGSGSLVAEADTTSSLSKTPRSPLAEEESNSCDCRGMSAIKLDDTNDGSSFEAASSNQMMPNRSAEHSGVLDDDDPDHGIWSSQQREPVSSSLPEGTFLFVPPCRYVFQGAEVYPADLHVESASAKSSPYHVAAAAAVTDSSSVSSNDDDDEDDTSTAACHEDSPGHLHGSSRLVDSADAKITSSSSTNQSSHSNSHTESSCSSHKDS